MDTYKAQEGRMKIWVFLTATVLFAIYWILSGEFRGESGLKILAASGVAGIAFTGTLLALHGKTLLSGALVMGLPVALGIYSVTCMPW